FFFFSSRRRHTRSKRDWSSDVCSSDLGQAKSHRIHPMPSGRRSRFLGSVIIACAATMTASQAATQRAPDYPVRPPALPEQVAHGQQVFRSNCSFCHGSDARGGETGPNLVRAQLVLADQQGELITPIVQNGLPAQGMPK